MVIAVQLSNFASIFVEDFPATNLVRLSVGDPPELFANLSIYYSAHISIVVRQLDVTS